MVHSAGHQVSTSAFGQFVFCHSLASYTVVSYCLLCKIWRSSTPIVMRFIPILQNLLHRMVHATSIFHGRGPKRLVETMYGSHVRRLYWTPFTLSTNTTSKTSWKWIIPLQHTGIHRAHCSHSQDPNSSIASIKFFMQQTNVTLTLWVIAFVLEAPPFTWSQECHPI